MGIKGQLPKGPTGSIPWRKTGQYIVLLFCAVVILRYFRQRWEELERILHLDPAALAVMALLGILIHALMGYKMLFILKKLGLKKIGYLPWLEVFSWSRFLNFHFLQGGNIYRSVRLKQDYTFSYTNSLGMMAIFAWFDGVFILFLSLLMVMGLDRKFSLMGINVAALLAFLLFLLAAGPFLCRSALRKFRLRNPRIVWMYEKLRYLTDSLTDNIRDKHALVSLFSLSFLTFILFVWQIYVVFATLGTKMDLAEVVVFVAITLLSGIINITPSNIGVIEVTYGYLSGILGKTVGSGIIACGILRIIGYITVLVFVIFSYVVTTRLKNKNKIISWDSKT